MDNPTVFIVTFEDVGGTYCSYNTINTVSNNSNSSLANDVVDSGFIAKYSAKNAYSQDQ